MDAQVFISHSSKDRKIAQTICGALENRGFTCWLSSRNVGGGENFQEAIVRAIRSAKVMVLVFTANANNSDEIKKELVVAGKYGLVVIPARVEDVVPNDAFMYEFATRQWIDLFEDWERAIEGLSSQIAGILNAVRVQRAATEGAPKRSTSGVRPRPPDPQGSGRAAALAAKPRAADHAPPPRPAREAGSAGGAAADLAAKQSSSVAPKSKPGQPGRDMLGVTTIEPAKPGAFASLAGLAQGAAATFGNPRVAALAVLAIVAIAGIAAFKGFTGPVSGPNTKLPEVLRPLSAADERALKPKDSFQECMTCPLMVTIAAGTFKMGSENEQERETTEGPVHQVTIKSFAIGRFAVTFDEWDACVNDGACDYKSTAWGRGRQPVINVSWWDAVAYVKWLSAKTGRAYRLPTEAEREYVTRAGTSTPFWWGRSITTDQANYNGGAYAGAVAAKAEFRGRTVPVQSFEPNEFGLHQVHGNVWEWMQDCWIDSYQRAPSDGSAVPGNCTSRSLRGGSWNDDPGRLRSASRMSSNSLRHDNNMGFRVAVSLAQ
jgi:formylglycine-generating enzyme required for sulfatase activity